MTSDQSDPRPAMRALFDSAAESYESVGVDYFARFGRQLVADLGLRAGQRVLDVGCGRGAVLFPAAEAVGPTGSVTGTDLSPEMVRLTAAEASGRGLSWVTVGEGDAQEPAAPAGPASAYDVVTAAFVVFFLPDPAAAAAAWRGLLVDGGRLGLTTFAGTDERWSVLDDMWAPFVPAEWRRGKDDSALTTSSGIEELLRAAGLVGVTTVERTHEVVFADLDQWYAWSGSQGQRLLWQRMGDRREEVRADAYERLRSIGNPDGSVTLHQGVRYTTARR